MTDSIHRLKEIGLANLRRVWWAFIGGMAISVGLVSALVVLRLIFGDLIPPFGNGFTGALLGSLIGCMIFINREER